MSDQIAYKGIKFTLIWYFDPNGNSQALEYFNNLDERRQDKAIYLFGIMANIGKISNDEKFVSEGDQIFAFKPVPDRFLCFFFSGGKIIITNAFEKKTQKIPPGEKARAVKYMNEYKTRVRK